MTVLADRRSIFTADRYPEGQTGDVGNDSISAVYGLPRLMKEIMLSDAISVVFHDPWPAPGTLTKKTLLSQRGPLAWQVAS